MDVEYSWAWAARPKNPGLGQDCMLAGLGPRFLARQSGRFGLWADVKHDLSRNRARPLRLGQAFSGFGPG
jgi:hypothetical protein